VTPYKPKGRRIYVVKVPRENKAWIPISTGSFHAATARRMQDMVDRLGPKGARAWDILDRLHTRTLSVGELFDRWVEAGQDVEQLRQSLRAVNLEPMVEEFLAAASCSKDTKEHYRSLLQRLMLEGEPFPVGDFTTARIQKAIDDLKASNATRRKLGAVVRSFANWLITRGVVQNNPVASVRLPKASAPRIIYLETADAIRLADVQPSPYKELSALLAGSGIEVSVALGLRRRDVDAPNREIRAAGTKTHARDRVVRVADWAWKYVATLLVGRLPDSRLFDQIPDRYTAGQVHRDAIAVLEKDFPIFKGYWMRDARHTFAVRAMKAGTPVELIARQLGHANATLLVQVYGRFLPRQDERAKWEKVATAQDEAKQREASGE
jgi:integrase